MLNTLNIIVTDADTLNLSYCLITDVSTLGRVYDLNLRNAPVTGIRALSRVHTLNLSNTLITDISALTYVYILYLDARQICTVTKSCIPELEVHW